MIMACAFVGEKANDNDVGEARVQSMSQPMPGDLISSGIVTGEDMLITRDPISGDWIVADYEGEVVLFILPRGSSLNEVRRAATIYASGFQIGFDQGRAIAQSAGFLR
jgi:hypothetical protein